jgi:hypothetical protein
MDTTLSEEVLRSRSMEGWKKRRTIKTYLLDLLKPILLFSVISDDFAGVEIYIDSGISNSD